MSPEMRERYEAMRTDSDLMNLTPEIALITIQLEDVARAAERDPDSEELQARFRSVAAVRARLIVAEAKRRKLMGDSRRTEDVRRSVFDDLEEVVRRLRDGAESGES